MFGDYLLNAQGEDVVAGIRNTEKIEKLAVKMPEVSKQFLDICAKLEKHYHDIQDVEFTIERGRLWVESGACKYCHGDDLAGTAFLDDPALGRIPAPNLTRGRGGAGSEFTDADWVRAIRYGANPEGKSLIIMPSSSYYYFSDNDLGDIIAYLKSLPKPEPSDFNISERCCASNALAVPA